MFDIPSRRVRIRRRPGVAYSDYTLFLFGIAFTRRGPAGGGTRPRPVRATQEKWARATRTHRHNANVTKTKATRRIHHRSPAGHTAFSTGTTARVSHAPLTNVHQHTRGVSGAARTGSRALAARPAPLWRCVSARHTVASEHVRHIPHRSAKPRSLPLPLYSLC